MRNYAKPTPREKFIDFTLFGVGMFLLQLSAIQLILSGATETKCQVRGVGSHCLAGWGGNMYLVSYCYIICIW